MSGGSLGEGQIAREARRVFRKLLAPGAHIAADPDGVGFALFVSDRAKTRRVAIAPEVMDACLRRDWLKPASGDPERWHLSAAGEGWYLRAQALSEPCAAQHRARAEKLIETAAGTARVTVNEGESPLGWLRHRRRIDSAQFDAGERLRRDYTLAQLTPRMGVDLSAPIVLGQRGAQAAAAVTQHRGRDVDAVGNPAQLARQPGTDAGAAPDLQADTAARAKQAAQRGIDAERISA